MNYKYIFDLEKLTAIKYIEFQIASLSNDNLTILKTMNELCDEDLAELPINEFFIASSDFSQQLFDYFESYESPEYVVEFEPDFDLDDDELDDVWWNWGDE